MPINEETKPKMFCDLQFLFDKRIDLKIVTIECLQLAECIVQCNEQSISVSDVTWVKHIKNDIRLIFTVAFRRENALRSANDTQHDSTEIW